MPIVFHTDGSYRSVSMLPATKKAKVKDAKRKRRDCMQSWLVVGEVGKRMGPQRGGEEPPPREMRAPRAGVAGCGGVIGRASFASYGDGGDR